MSTAFATFADFRPYRSVELDGVKVFMGQTKLLTLNDAAEFSAVQSLSAERQLAIFTCNDSEGETPSTANKFIIVSFASDTLFFKTCRVEELQVVVGTVQSVPTAADSGLAQLIELLNGHSYHYTMMNFFVTNKTGLYSESAGNSSGNCGKIAWNELVIIDEWHSWRFALTNGDWELTSYVKYDVKFPFMANVDSYYVSRLQERRCIGFNTPEGFVVKWDEESALPSTDQVPAATAAADTQCVADQQV